MNFFTIFPAFSLLVFFAILLVKVYFLKKEQIQVSAKPNKKSKLKILLYPVYLFIFGLIVIEIIQPFLQTRFSPFPEVITRLILDSVWLKVAGTLVVAISLIMVSLALKHAGRSFRFGTNEKNDGNLVTSGIFSLSRNPFFLSIEIFLAGITFLIPNLFFMTILAMAILIIHFYILKEEEFLWKNYGDEYKKYTEKTSRYFFVFRKR